MVSEMNITVNYTNGSFYKNSNPKMEKESTCNLRLENLILKTRSANIVEDFYDPNLKLYIYPVAWSSGSKSLQCPSLTNDELAESAKMILSENNTRELIEANIPMFDLPVESKGSKIQILFFVISFRENGIIRKKLFDKIEQAVKKSDLNKLVKQQNEIPVKNEKELIEKLRKKVLEHLDVISEVKCFHYKGTCLQNEITLNHILLQAKIKINMNETLSKTDISSIPNLNGKRLPQQKPQIMRGGLESTKISLAPLSLCHSAKGDIEQVLFALPATSKGKERVKLLDVVRELIKTVHGVEITLVVEMDKDEADIEQWKKQVEKEIKELETEIPEDSNNTLKIIKKDIRGIHSSFSVWAQDAVIPAVSEDGKNYLLTPNTPKRTERRNDGSIAKSVAGAAPRYHFGHFNFQLEGGNILVADDFILIGKDEVLHNIGDKDDDAAERKFLEKFKRDIGDKRPVFFVNVPYKDYERPQIPVPVDDEKETVRGELFELKDQYSRIYDWRGNEQPIFHIDVFMTLLGCNEAGEYELLVGEPVAGFDADAPEIDAGIRTLLNYQLKDAQDRINECIENLKTDFQNKLNTRLKIHRNPLPLTFSGGLVRSQWYWASYNNCIIQNSKNKTVWLPTYGHQKGFNTHLDYLKKYDSENKEVFSKLGYKVHLLDADFNFFARKGGSLHCLSKSILRNVSQLKLPHYGNQN